MSIKLTGDENIEFDSLEPNQIYVSLYEMLKNGETPKRPGFKLAVLDLDIEQAKELWTSLVANRVWVGLRVMEGGKVIVEVEDNQGIDPPNVSHTVIERWDAHTTLDGPEDQELIAVVEKALIKYADRSFGLREGSIDDLKDLS